MPVQVHIDRPHNKNLDTQILLPGFFGLTAHRTYGEPEILGIYCQDSDTGQAIVSFTEGVIEDERGIHFENPDEAHDGTILLVMEEDTVYEDTLLDEQGVKFKLASYHLGGLASFYAFSLQ
ncbi:hypothetical protein KW792_00965 [Candidatus Saccharibacteria bacterium]|nr:hypothetical protein [Candidatus Saccharibacteria bacterium]